MKNIFLKKIYLFIFCFFILNSFAQEEELEVTYYHNDVIKGDVFDLKIKTFTSTTSCNGERKVIINVGQMKYVASSLNDDWQIDYSTIAIDGNIKLINSQNTTIGGGTQENKITLKFEDGTTCHETSQIITSNLICSNGSVLIDSDTTTILANTINNSNLQIVRSFPDTVDNNYCIGTGIYIYNVTARNPLDIATNSFNLNNAKITLDLDTCAEVVSVAKEVNGEFQAVNYTFNGTQDFVEWNIGNLNVSNINSYKVYIKYPCTTCVVNNTINNPIGRLSGDNNCFSTTYISSNFLTQSQTNFIPSCEKCSIIDYSIDNTSISFPCPTICDPEINVSYSIDVLPGNQISNVILEADVPINIGNPILENNDNNPMYLYNGQWYAFNSLNSSITAEKLRWTFTINNTNLPYRVSKKVKYESNNLASIPFPTFNYRLLNSDNNNIEIFNATKTSGPASCNDYVTISKVVKKQNSSDNFASFMYSVPSQNLTYRIIIRNVNNGIQNITFEDILDTRHSYIGNFKYGYVTNSSVNSSTLSSLTTINNSVVQITDIPELGTINVTTNDHLVKIFGFNLIKNCESDKYLIIEFDVNLNDNLLYDELIENTVRVFKNSNIIVSSSMSKSTIRISDLFSVRNSMSVKCMYDNDWKNEIHVKNGDQLNFKMEFINDGSVPINLEHLINLKPKNNDKNEVPSNGILIDRGSTCQIDYNECNSNQIIITQSTQSNVVPAFKYSENSENMARTLLTPSVNNSSELPLFDKPCYESNWMMIEFNESDGIILYPGDKIEVIYSGLVIGQLGTTAYNSFSYNATSLKNNIVYPFNSDNSNYVTIINDDETECSPPPCYDCTSFNLLKEEKYLVSAWVKEEYTNNPNQQFKTYTKSIVSISFTDVSGLVINSPFEFYPSGEIIDGWQRIIGEFIVPTNVDDMTLELVNLSDDGKVSYFDDVRVLPSRGNMKSFVYDQKTQRLMAELDENNYSTFYEYDLEGGLIRIKKETERGVFTIQETRSGNVKN